MRKVIVDLFVVGASLTNQLEKVKEDKKMRGKLLGVLFITLVLVLSLSLVAITPAGKAGAEDPPVRFVAPWQLTIKNADSTAEWSIAQVKSGSYAVYLDSGTTTAGEGDEARIRIEISEDKTLNDITSISWYEYLVAGYPPHVDVMIDIDGNGTEDDALVFEYAYNGGSHYTDEAPMPYGALTGVWYQTFSDDGHGPAAINDTSYAWLSSQAAGPLGGGFGDNGHYGTTLGEWKAGKMTPPGDISGATTITALEIEVDNWVVNSEAYVDDITVNGYPCYGLIQDAVDSADPGDVIDVAPGIYDEQVVINKGLTIQGYGDNTIIKPSQATADAFQLFARGTGGNDSAPIVVATSSGNTASIRNLKIDGSLVSSVPGGASLFAGILYRDTNGLVDTVTVENIGAIYGGCGMYLVGHDTAVGVEVRNCNVSGYSKNGITANYPNINANIHDNTVIGMGPTDATAQNGIQIGYGATGTIGINNVSGHVWTGTYGGSNDPATDPDADGACGILLYHPGETVAMAGNNLTGNQFGIWSVGAASINVHDNIITGLAHMGNAYPTGIVVSDSDMWSDDFGYTEVATTGAIIQNTFTSHDYGVLVLDYTAGGALPAVSVGGNSFSSNHIHLVDTAGTLNMQNIWDTSTFDRAVVVDRPGASLLHAVWSKIQDGIHAASDNDTVKVAAGTYQEGPQIVIDKNLSIVGENKATTIINPSADTGSSSDARGWFLVNDGKTFNLSDVTLDGSEHKVYQAIRHKGAGTIANCTFNNIQYDASGPAYSGMAMAVMGNGNVDVTGCTFTAIGRIGVIFFGTGVTDSHFSHNTYTGKGTGDWLDYGVEVGGGARATINDNNISGNLGEASVDGSTSAGILVTTYYDAGTQATIIGNTLTGNTEGIAVGYDDADTSTVTAHNNNISGNTVHGIGTTAPAVDATNNWWGAVTGPKHATTNPYSSGDEVSGNITYSPWLDAAYPDGNQREYNVKNITQDTTYNFIQAAIDAASDNDTINVAAGTYAGAVVDRAVKLYGAGDGTSVITSGVPYKVDNDNLHTAFRPDVDGVEIRNFTIDCDVTEDLDLGVYAIEVDGVTVDSLTINSDGTVQGITNWGGSDWVITNNVIANTLASGGGGIGIFVGAKAQQQCTGNLIQYNEVNATATAESYSCPGICLCLDTRYGQYDLLDGNEDISGNQILNNTITAAGANNGVGIEVGTILGNSEGDPDRTDPGKIAALMATGALHDNTVQGNTINGAYEGIYLYNVTGLTITENEISNSVNNGIYIDYAHSGTAIQSNDFANNNVQVLDDSEALDTEDVLVNNTFDRTVVIDRDGESFLPAIWSSIQDAVDATSENDTIMVSAGTYNESVTINTDNLTISGDVSQPAITGGLKLDTNLTGLTLENFYVTGTVDPAYESIVRMYGSITDLTVDNCVFDGEDVSDRMGFTGGQIEGDLTVTMSEFKGIKGWALFDSRSGSGGDGSVMGNVIFANNNIHNCDGSVVFRGLSTDWTDNVSIYGNIFEDIGQVGVSDHWAAFEVNRADNVEIHDNQIHNIVENSWGEGQAMQLWKIGTVNIHHNTVENNYQGIAILKWPTEETYDISNVSILNNSFSGNDQYALSVESGLTGGPVNAEDNYWGAVTGPKQAATNPCASGDELTGEADYTPWLDASGGNQRHYNVKNITQDTTYNCIQEAIDNATDNNTINVLAGTYNGALDLKSKPLIIDGAGVDTTIVDASSETGYAVNNFGDSTTIKNLTLVGSAHYGFKVSHVSNVTFDSVKVEDSGKTAFDLNTVDNAVLTNIEAIDTLNGFGLMILDSNNIIVTNIATDGNAWGGVSVQTKYASSGNITFSGDFDAKEDAALLLEKDPPDYYDITGVIIPGKFGNVVYAFREGDEYQQTFYQESLGDAKSFAQSLMDSEVFTYSDMTIYDIAEENYYLIEGMLIQDAIAAVTPGNTINVAPGTYTEAIAISKPLTLRGATADVNKNDYTVPAEYAWDDMVESIINHPDPSSGYIAIVDIVDTDNVTFEGFVVQELNAEGNKNSSLIRVRAQTQEMSNIVVRNNIIGPNTNVVSQDGTHGRMGLYLVNNPYSDLYGIVNSTFSGNKIFDTKGNGNNVFIWSSYYGYGATGPASMSGTVIEDNEISGSHRTGIETAGGFSGLTIRNNSIHGNYKLEGDTPDLKYGNGILMIRGSSDRENVEGYGPVNVTLEDNDIYNNDGHGIYMGPNNEGITITRNNLHNNGQDGIMVDLIGNYWNPDFEPEPGPHTNLNGSWDIPARLNRIYDNGQYGIRVIGNPTNDFVLDAVNNWWGTPDGTAIATKVSDHVDYDPWHLKQISDLVANHATENSIDLSWTTIGAWDGDYFDIRYSNANITSTAEWNDAKRVTGEPTPSDGPQKMRVRGLNSGITYYFGLKLADVNHSSYISKSDNVTTLAVAAADATAPAQVTTLAVSAGSPATTRAILSWTATGDDVNDGFASKYVIKRSTSPITAANFNSTTTVYNTLAPKENDKSESFSVTRLSPNTTYYFAIKVQDERLNTSAISNVVSITTANVLPRVSGISQATGDNAEARTLTITGTNFVSSGITVVRLTSNANTFALTNVAYVSETELRAVVPKGVPAGTYKARVINNNGTSGLSSVTYTVTEASTPLPVVTNLTPQMAASDTAISNVRIFGKNFTSGNITVRFDGIAATIINASNTKITVDVPGLPAGEYDVRVTTSAGENEASAVKFVVTDPVIISEETTEDTTTSGVVDLDTNVIPVQITLTTDDSETATQNTDTDAEISVVIPPGTTITDSAGDNYTGAINPPRVVKPEETIAADLPEDAIVIEMGNTEETINFDQDFVATVTVTADTEPDIYYYNKDTGEYELAGKSGTKDGINYVPGGTVLGLEDSTYTIGLLLDHMSVYVASVESLLPPEPEPEPTPSGGGGGGAPDARSIRGTTDLRGFVTTTGRFIRAVTATSADKLCTLNIPRGTVGLTKDLQPITEITMLTMDEPPSPPESAHIVGLAYNLGPDGSTFDPAITLTWKYDPGALPEGVAEEDLIIAYYDEDAGKWVKMDGTVDTENDTITALVSHFTTFAVIGALEPELAPEPIPETAPEPAPTPETAPAPEPEPTPVPVPEPAPEITPPAGPAEPEPVPPAKQPEELSPATEGWIIAVIVLAALAVLAVAFIVIRSRIRARG